MSCLFLDALPETAVLQEFCVQHYVKEIQESDFKIQNTANNTYVYHCIKPFKRYIAWKIVATFLVEEYDDPALVIKELVIYDQSPEDSTPVVKVKFEYNNDPKSLKYMWGQFKRMHVEYVQSPIWYLHVLACFQDAWLHKLVFAHATRRVISAHPKHTNIRPKYIHDLEPFTDAIKHEGHLKI